MSYEGVAYDPVRLNPLANIQYADYSNIQYLQTEDSDNQDAKGLS